MTVGTPCSLQSAAVGEPLAGTAPVAGVWVIVEQNGPWGRDVLVESRLPDRAKAALRTMKDAGAGVLLARRPDREERAAAEGHHVFVARSTPGDLALHETVVADLADLADWDPLELAAGRVAGIGAASIQPALFVCTHSRRDACCAVHGRALLAHLLDRAPAGLRDRVWECSHIGGHRFAPVSLSLPSGAVHGRCSLDEGVEVLARLTDGRLLPSRLRGRTCFPPPLQAADVAVRRLADVDGEDDVSAYLMAESGPVTVPADWRAPEGDVPVLIRHRDGRTWLASVRRVTDDVLRAESCGKEPLPVQSWVVADVIPG